MTPARWQQVKETLASALEHETTGARADFLAQTCVDDTALRGEVEALLAHSPDAFQSWADEGGFLRAELKKNEARRIGAYRLVRELGRGGMGAVWLAERAEQGFQQTAAIKLLKRGTDTEEVLRRFQAERQILARLEHPGIGRLFDGGETDDGLPFFVMEFIAGGEPLTTYARKHKLSLTARLYLFRKVCAAVQFAHQNLVVHRDLKPGNILVTPEGEPKLLDFGIAKLLTPGEDAWEVTLAGRERLTPNYASPEQVRGESISTASDVYSLGTLLYELLCEQKAQAFSAERPLQEELLQVICETEPLRPSLAAKPETRRALRGDLETIILRAMAKASARRYDSVEQFSTDIRRFLEGLPVRARKDTLAYRTSKFLRRNKLGLTIATLIGLTLIGGLIDAIIQRNRAERQRIRVEEGEDKNRQLLYAAQMSLAYQAWESANVGRALDLLEAQRPASGHEDLRDFEWYLLWRLTHESSRILAGPITSVHSVSFSQDGRKIVGGSVDGKVYIWDAASGTLSNSFDADFSGHENVALSPDGNFLFTGSADGLVKLWAVDNGRLVRSFRAHNKAVHSLALSRNGRTLATASDDGTAKLWNAATSEELMTLRGHADAVNKVAFSPDGLLLATSSRDHTAKVWDTGTGSEIATLRGHTWWLLDATFSPDGKILGTTGSDGDVRLWDVAEQRETMLIRGDGRTINSVRFSPDGKTLAIGNNGNTIKLYDAPSGKLMDVLRSHSDYLGSIAFSPDGRNLVSGSGDHRVRLWDLTKKNGAVVFQGHQDWVWALAFSPDGRTLASASKDATVKLWDLATGREKLTLLHPLWVNAVQFSPDGIRIATGCDDTFVRVWSPLTGENLFTLRGQESIVESLAFSADSKLLASGSKHGEIKLWNAAGKEVGTLRSPDNNLIWSLAFSPDGKYLAAAEGGMNEGASKTGHLVTIWEVSSGRLVTTLRGHTLDVHALAFSPDGKMLASGSWDGTIKLWNASNYQEIVSLKTSQVQSLAFSSDGRRLVSAGSDKTVKLWDVATQQELCTLTDPSEINSVAFSPDAGVLAVGGNDNKVRLWFAATKEETKNE